MEKPSFLQITHNSFFLQIAAIWQNIIRHESVYEVDVLHGIPIYEKKKYSHQNSLRMVDNYDNQTVDIDSMNIEINTAWYLAVSYHK